jgi:hypothetical protein
MELWDRFWRDDRGRIVIWQMPNAYLIAWAVLTIASLATANRTSDIFAGAASFVLIVWAGLEIFKGANYFRRLLGLVVLVYAIMTFIKIF